MKLLIAILWIILCLYLAYKTEEPSFIIVCYVIFLEVRIRTLEEKINLTEDNKED